MPSPRFPGYLLQEILYNPSRQENFLGTGVEIERQKRRARAGDGTRSEDRVAEKAPQNDSFLESNTTGTGRRTS